ncbi:autotransporter outer membrane beta-barrel domain-containing protein [Flavobacterium pedocola]
MMKKVLLFGALFLSLSSVKAQSKNEVKLNILNTIALASVEVGYERFLDSNQSIGVEILINDQFAYLLEKSGERFNTNSVLASYNFYFANNGGKASGYYMYPFIKYRFGDFEEKKTVEGAEITVKTDMDSFILGLGSGYKWVWNDKFAIGPYASIARNFSEDVNDKFIAIEINAGFSIGYRF